MKNRVVGMLGVGCYDACYNNDFDKNPREDAVGDIFATNGSIEYTMKRFFNDHLDLLNGLQVLGLSRTDEKGVNYSLSEMITKHFQIPMDSSKTVAQIRDELVTHFIDVILFGLVFAPGKGEKGKATNVHGAISTSYGHNLWEDPVVTSSQVQSPYRNDKNETAERTTLGSQVRMKEGHYVHTFVVNPKNLDECVSNAFHGLTEDHYNLWKKAALHSVTYYSSASKLGCMNEFGLFVTLKDDISDPGLCYNYVSIVPDGNGRPVYDLTKVAEALKDVEDDIESVEIYYNPHKISVTGDIANAVYYNIVSGKQM